MNIKIVRFFNADTATGGGAAIPASEAGGAYGYTDDTAKISPFSFGLNPGKCFLKKFEFIPNGGAGGAEQEALDIVFSINDTEKSYRKFPVVKAYGANNEEITDRNAPEFKDAVKDFNATITHVLHAFVESDAIKQAMARPITSFKDFCQIAASILPTNFSTKPLDIFLQYQWQIDEGQDRTYLDIPKKMKYGAWLKPAVPVKGVWVEKRVPKEQLSDSVQKALWYVDSLDETNEHPFTKNGWFMQSAFANQQKTGSAATSGGANTAAAAQATQADGAKKASTW